MCSKQTAVEVLSKTIEILVVTFTGLITDNNGTNQQAFALAAKNVGGLFFHFSLVFVSLFWVFVHFIIFGVLFYFSFYYFSLFFFFFFVSSK
jgi:hypothetical protein